MIAAVAEYRAFRVAFLTGSVAVLLALGVFGLGHGGLAETNLDTRYLYLAGKYWHAGLSAYAPTFTLPVDPAVAGAVPEYNFAYPPQGAPLCLLLASGSWASAFVTMSVLNLAAVGALAYFGVRLTEQVVPSAFVRDGLTAQRWFIPALIIGNLSTAFVVWMGQTSLIVAAALAGAWYFSRGGRWVLAGILLAIATIKPPLSMFVALWFVLDRQWRVLGAMSGAILLFSAVPMSISGPFWVFPEWLAAIAHYGGHPNNALGSRMIVNLPSFLHALGIATPDLLVVGVGATVALWYYRRKFVEDDFLGVLVAIALLFGYGHSYDLAALVVLIPAFWRHLHTRPGGSLVALGLLLAISFPNSLLVRFESDLLLHARVALVLGAVIWLLMLSADEAKSRAASAPTTA